MKSLRSRASGSTQAEVGLTDDNLRRAVLDLDFAKKTCRKSALGRSAL
jgi:hypothetical protein